jgi:UDP-glucose:(heptosyl)LPS alpha-1,3-glucosyltransferase
VRVVYSGVDCERFHPGLREAGRAKIAALFSLPHTSSPQHEPPPVAFDGRERYLAFVGNDYHRKGLDLVLEALAALLQRGPARAAALRLIVAGRDARAAAYERKARSLGLASRARFLGSRPDVPDLLAGSDVLLLPSYFDAYANVSSEALASGTPVIASATSGAAELIRAGHGWVLAQNGAVELGKALESFLSVEDLGPMRAAARKAALELRWDKHYSQIEDLYGELVGAQKV